MRRAYFLIPRNAWSVVACGLLGVSSLAAQTAEPPKAVQEPVYRVARLDDAPATGPVETAPAPTMTADATAAAVPAANASNTTARTPHPLDQAIDIAHNRLNWIRQDVKDYQAIMVKRERIDGTLNDPEYMKVKIRNRRTLENGKQVPFSVYMRFLKPKSIRGREVIFVEGMNGGKIVAHDTGLTGLVTVFLDPTGFMAMKNSRYPIYDAGLENLVAKLIEKAERDREAGLCQVDYIDTAKINDRPCMKIKVVHDEQRAPFDFHMAEVFIDQELQLPVRYAAYDWPTAPGGEPQLLEEYTYLNLELNKGFGDKDFDHKNPEYEYR